jgi:hypothetical protein
VYFFGPSFLLKVTWLAFGLAKLDCDENRKLSRMKAMRLTRNEHHRKLRVPIRDISAVSWRCARRGKIPPFVTPTTTSHDCLVATEPDDCTKSW